MASGCSYPSHPSCFSALALCSSLPTIFGMPPVLHSTWHRICHTDDMHMCSTGLLQPTENLSSLPHNWVSPTLSFSQHPPLISPLAKSEQSDMKSAFVVLRTQAVRPSRNYEHCDIHFWGTGALNLSSGPRDTQMVLQGPDLLPSVCYVPEMRGVRALISGCISITALNSDGFSSHSSL